MKNNQPGMTLIVKAVTRLTVGLILIYGIYIVLRGHISPGGGFAGGVIIALSFIHLMLAFGKDAVLKKLSQERVVMLAGLGALAFLFLVTLEFFKDSHGLIVGNHFKLFSAGFIPLCDVAIAFAMGMGLFAIFLVLTLLTSDKE